MCAKLPIGIVTLLAAFMAIFAVNASAQTMSGNGTKSESKQPSSSPDLKPDAIESRVEKYLRNVYAWGPSYEVKVGTPKQSPIPDLLEVLVSVSADGQGDTAIVYVSKNGDFIIQGQLLDTSIDPFADNRSKLHPGNSPSMGPENAKITLVEFADFECPSCRQLDRILRDFLPSHPDVRLVFKNFPLKEIHPWAMAAAVAGLCTYQQNPATFWKMHDAIFDAQDDINPSNVQEKMLDLTTKLGLNVEAFKACISSPQTTHQVEDTLEEGRTLHLTATPTTFVNGRRLVGADGLLLDQLIQFEKSPN